ncbi:AraC family transcriptional regulator [Paraburkholderia silvatlantica]|uniref:AraC-like DNA-binding protein n=1 Tax=Paraburkholderia silvatlantica TaxID=321895 RepID=A0ABR6FHA1_9BURK|nr:AraC family transcriptional regulator [Paraburkholderia silvatlantica]MBB2926799.1 AraC-like DNA-binding protein [Paraburkholderia silvatlantica]PVY37574.1 AraC family transcriptional regulator [Paraburkholderia silvatlantica]PXW42536.1 AraC family transcriptional regulator [Paraburkholderia silvatlantica]
MQTFGAAAAHTSAPCATHSQPDLELVAVPRDESFKVWSHGYPYRTVRWHFHPEYEIHLITATTGKYFVGDFIGSFAPGNLVMIGPNLPHNWVSSVPHDEPVDERCLVLQFDADFIARAINAFPEFRRVQALLDASCWGLLFTPETGAAAEPILREMLGAQGMRRVTLFIDLLDLLVQSGEPAALASEAYRADPARYAGTRINHVLAFIGKNLSQELRETELAELAGQSVSAFSRYFRRHTGVSFVRYVNQLRINLACQLLMSGELNITNICYQVGFNNLSNFNRQFLLIKEMSPSRWRSYQRLNAASAASKSEAVYGAPAIG